MISEIRDRYNAEFTSEKYDRFMADLTAYFGTPLQFRVAETPLFFPKSFRKKLEEAGETVLKTILLPNFKELTEGAVSVHCNVPQEDEHTLFLALDFAVCKDEHGELSPQLIELQGFPSIFGFQEFVQQKYREHFYVPDGFSVFLSDLSHENYVERFRALLLNGHNPKHVVLLEVEPEKQATNVDFIATENLTGIKTVCISKVIREDRKLYYRFGGEKIEIKRIYNRVIFDEFITRDDLKCEFHLTEPVDVEWAGHPNWFFRISKYIMPFLDSVYVPESRFLNEVEIIPADLENYVLKPLFSFSGSGVKFHVTKADIDSVPPRERSNYLLQKKVKYEPIIQAPDGLVKAEIRLLYFWEPGNDRPELVVNLARLSRGEMIGVKFNKDKTWVGGSVCFFEE
jgi:hypothetical protein